MTNFNHRATHEKGGFRVSAEYGRGFAACRSTRNAAAEQCDTFRKLLEPLHAGDTVRIEFMLDHTSRETVAPLCIKVF